MSTPFDRSRFEALRLQLDALRCPQCHGLGAHHVHKRLGPNYGTFSAQVCKACGGTGLFPPIELKLVDAAGVEPACARVQSPAGIPATHTSTEKP